MKAKKTKEATAAAAKKHCLPLSGIWGILVLFVVASISYTSYVVIAGTQGLVPKLMVIPQALFAIIIALYKFSNS